MTEKKKYLKLFALVTGKEGFDLIFTQMEHYGSHQQVLFFQDPSVRLKGIIAIHNTRLGPALGGCRIWPYASEEDALLDVLKLSRGMTYKAALAGLTLGGGKSVIIGDPKHKTPEMFQSFGRFVHSLNGNYITAEDVGTSVKDMGYVKEQTPFVVGLPRDLGGAGDPSPFTARSTLMGIKAAVQHQKKTDTLKNLKVAIQGAGHVGCFLAEYLLKEGCKVTLCDIFEEKARTFCNKHPGVSFVPCESIYDEPCDVFSPCALGAVLNPESLKRLKCSIIAGAANNQLDTSDTEKIIQEKGMLYAPDFVINAGGLINVFVESRGNYNTEEVTKRIDNIYHVLLDIFTLSQKQNKWATCVAVEMAQKHISSHLNHPGL